MSLFNKKHVKQSAWSRIQAIDHYMAEARRVCEKNKAHVGAQGHR